MIFLDPKCSSKTLLFGQFSLHFILFYLFNFFFIILSLLHNFFNGLYVLNIQTFNILWVFSQTFIIEIISLHIIQIILDFLYQCPKMYIICFYEMDEAYYKWNNWLWNKWSILSLWYLIVILYVLPYSEFHSCAKVVLYTCRCC